MRNLRLVGSLSLIVLLLSGCIERKPERLARQESPVSASLREMVAREDSLRKADSSVSGYPAAVRRAHREAVYQFLAEALIREPVDLYRAALLLQSADQENQAESCLLGHFLAKQAALKGYRPARFLSASLRDRYLTLTTGSQHFGTQQYKDSVGLYHLFPVDSAVSDSERAEWDVPSLDSLLLEIKALNRP